jgi:hypothetical protein
MDVVRNYLLEQGYPDFVVRGGIAKLVEGWERIVDSVVAGQEQCQDDYLNDMDGRHILEKVISIAPTKERELWSGRVAAADEKIRAHLIPTSECIWGEENAEKYRYVRERDWWYYHRPRIVEPEWRSY